MAHREGMLLVKTLLLFLFGILVWLCPLSSCRCRNLKFLNLQGMQASQVSTFPHNGRDLSADLAIDGDPRTRVDDFTCSHTGNTPHPWWKVDLGTNHCLGRITIVNRGSNSDRLSGAIVRAGKDTDIFKNAVCGSPVTLDKASIPGAHMKFVCDPPMVARYVSVDDDKVYLTGSNDNYLTLCEVMVEEYPMEDCLQTTTALTTDTSFAIAGMMSSLLFEGKCIVDARPLSVVHMKSLVQCFVSCKMNSECWSFDYVTISRRCRLYDVKAGEMKADNQPGCLVYVVVRG